MSSVATVNHPRNRKDAPFHPGPLCSHPWQTGVCPSGVLHPLPNLSHVLAYTLCPIPLPLTPGTQVS